MGSLGANYFVTLQWLSVVQPAFTRWQNNCTIKPHVVRIERLWLLFAEKRILKTSQHLKC